MAAVADPREEEEDTNLAVASMVVRIALLLNEKVKNEHTTSHSLTTFFILMDEGAKCCEFCVALLDLEQGYFFLQFHVTRGSAGATKHFGRTPYFSQLNI